MSWVEDIIRDRLTAARAANLDQITAARLLQLDGANMPASIAAILAAVGVPQPLWQYETWQDAGGVDPTKWALTNPATGTAWTISLFQWLYCQPNNNEECRLQGIQYWPDNSAGAAGVNTFNNRGLFNELDFEFSLRIFNVGHIDNATAFFGLSWQTQKRNGNSGGKAGFGLNADTLQTITKQGAVETANGGFGETISDVNKYKIALTTGHVKFYLNEVLIADHTTNLPQDSALANFYFISDGSGGYEIDAFPMRIGLVPR